MNAKWLRISGVFLLLVVFLSWSGVGATSSSRIVFTEPDGSGNGEIWIMDDDGSNLEQLTDDAYDDIEPALCGQRIVFASDRSGKFDIWSMRFDGTDLTNLTPGGEGLDNKPDCDPTGPLPVLFRSTMDSVHGEIYSVPLTGGTITRLTNDYLEDDEPSWCGTRVVFTKKLTPSGQPPYDRWKEVMLMDADGDNVDRMSCDDMEDLDPGCDPDGEQIALALRDWVDGEPDTASHIYRFPVCSPDANCCPYCCFTPEARVVLTIDGPLNMHPRWSPGGTQITFASNRVGPIDDDSDWEIYKMDSEVGEEYFLLQLTVNHPENDEDPDWAEVRRPSP